ncbi:hypothetical protein BGZ65_005579 [Modicella reniformis]|uniref:PITH domain-containing protein n=1 Tax=Modicella reniformis TaxID=1440133 RepID=A0A9P6M1U7_9FUNG|nr:hypothetical protein BGZ65_005579 [Modicella reniformis]
MSHCHDEAHGHGHGHSHGHGHDHDHESPDAGLVHESLYKKIDHDNVICMNEAVPNSGKSVLKPWHEKMDDTIVQFTGLVKLKSISIIAEPGESAPSKMKAYVNKDDLDFDGAASTDPIQEWDLVEDSRGQVAEYNTRVARFNNVRNLTLYFSENFGGDTTKISFIGLKGEFSEVRAMSASGSNR